jgi:sulfide:quinone oxidoreductase
MDYPATETVSSSNLSGLRTHTPNFATVGQISPDDVEIIHSLGFRTIISNRPDFEGGELQPTSKEIEQEAHSQGLNFYYLPVSPVDMTDEDAQELKGLLNLAPGPVLAYCLSGSRSTQLFLLSQLV